MKRIHPYLLLALCTILFAGCMVGGKYSRPPVAENIIYPEATSMDTATLVTWFEIYHDPVLQNLIKAALDSNRDLLAAGARMQQAMALSGAVKANLYPNVSYQAQAGGGKAGSEATKIAAGIDGGFLSVFGVLNWEI